MTEYRITLGAFTTTGRPLTTTCIEIPEADHHEQALDLARREFFGRTALVSGVRVEALGIEVRRGKTYLHLIRASRIKPGTWLRMLGQWRCVARWEPVGDGVCRLFTRLPSAPYERNEGVYGRDDVFETR